MTSEALETLSPDRLAAFLDEQRAAYEALRARDLRLDLTRGKPSTEQLDLSDGLLRLPEGTKDRAGVDVRNYGGLEGLVELREVFAELLGVDVDAVVCGGNSSLTMMHQAMTFLMLFGGPGSPRPWKDEEVVRFVCPVPGYDRHFSMLADLGIEMVTVPMLEDGPDLDAVREVVTGDPAVKGMWLVPTYANPSGSVVSPREGARPGGDGDRRAGLPHLLGQRLRPAPPHRRRGRQRGRAGARRRARATRTDRSCLPRPPRSPSPAPASR